MCRGHHLCVYLPPLMISRNPEIRILNFLRGILSFIYSKDYNILFYQLPLRKQVCSYAKPLTFEALVHMSSCISLISFPYLSIPTFALAWLTHLFYAQWSNIRSSRTCIWFWLYSSVLSSGLEWSDINKLEKTVPIPNPSLEPSDKKGDQDAGERDGDLRIELMEKTYNHPNLDEQGTIRRNIDKAFGIMKMCKDNVENIFWGTNLPKENIWGITHQNETLEGKKKEIEVLQNQVAEKQLAVDEGKKELCRLRTDIDSLKCNVFQPSSAGASEDILSLSEELRKAEKKTDSLRAEFEHLKCTVNEKFQLLQARQHLYGQGKGAHSILQCKRGRASQKTHKNCFVWICINVLAYIYHCNA